MGASDFFESTDGSALLGECGEAGPDCVAATDCLHSALVLQGDQKTEDGRLGKA